MAEPLPNCPLCDGQMHPLTYTDMFWCHNTERSIEKRGSCPMPLVKEHQLRALAALRKPLTEQDADALVERIVDRERKLDAGRNDEHPAYMASWNAWHAVLDEVRAALTGKRSPPA